MQERLESLLFELLREYICKFVSNRIFSSFKGACNYKVICIKRYHHIYGSSTAHCLTFQTVHCLHCLYYSNCYTLLKLHECLYC